MIYIKPMIKDIDKNSFSGFPRNRMMQNNDSPAVEKKITLLIVCPIIRGLNNAKSIIKANICIRIKIHNMIRYFFLFSLTCCLNFVIVIIILSIVLSIRPKRAAGIHKATVTAHNISAIKIPSVSPYQCRPMRSSVSGSEIKI